MNEEEIIEQIRVDPEFYYRLSYEMQSNIRILTEFVKNVGYVPSKVSNVLSPEELQELKPYIKYKIEGLRDDTYIGRIYGEEYEKNEYGELGYIMGELPKKVICCSRGDRKFEIGLYKTYSLSSSGYTTDSRGNIEIHEVDEFNGITKQVKDEQTFIFVMKEDGFECPAFSVRFTGGDEYYPSGDISVNEKLFTDMDKNRNEEVSLTREDALALIKEDIGNFENLSQELKSDKEFVLEALKIDSWETLSNISEELLNDREVMLEAVKIDGNNLGFSPNLWNDDELVLEAIKTYPQGYGDKLMNDKEFILKAIKVNPEVFEWEIYKEWENDKEVFKSYFDEIIKRQDVVNHFKDMEPRDIENIFGTEVAKMVGFEQKNSHHCYDLWEHSLRTVEGISEENLTTEQFTKLRVAAFFHDIGKPDVAKINEKTGQQVFYGHAAHSAEVAKPILEKIGYSEDEIKQLSFFIAHHDDFISYKSNVPEKMKSHEFVREINTDTIAEKIIENKYDFEKMGYDKDQVRAIVYTLAHGEEPAFTDFKGEIITIPINMEEVKEKINSGEYDSEYNPSLEDYQMLLQLCKADAKAQSERAERTLPDGRVVVDGTKKEKLENMNNIENSIQQAYEKTENIVQSISKDKEELVENIVKEEQDLDSLSEDELENMLKLQQEQNQSKKEELDNIRKQELIAQIRATQQEGKELDEQIAEAKKNNRLRD